MKIESVKLQCEKLFAYRVFSNCFYDVLSCHGLLHASWLSITGRIYLLNFFSYINYIYSYIVIYSKWPCKCDAQIVWRLFSIKWHNAMFSDPIAVNRIANQIKRKNNTLFLLIWANVISCRIWKMSNIPAFSNIRPFYK